MKNLWGDIIEEIKAGYKFSKQAKSGEGMENLIPQDELDAAIAPTIDEPKTRKKREQSKVRKARTADVDADAVKKYADEPDDEEASDDTSDNETIYVPKGTNGPVLGNMPISKTDKNGGKTKTKQVKQNAYFARQKALHDKNKNWISPNVPQEELIDKYENTSPYLFDKIQDLGFVGINGNSIDYETLWTTFKSKIKGRTMWAFDAYGDECFELAKYHYTVNTPSGPKNVTPWANWGPAMDEIFKSYYYVIQPNTNGRLGQVFELLFGQTPHPDSEADFGTKTDEPTEAKTKDTGSNSGIIAIAGNQIYSLNNLCSGMTSSAIDEHFADKAIGRAIIECEKKLLHATKKRYKIADIKPAKDEVSFTIPSSELFRKGWGYGGLFEDAFQIKLRNTDTESDGSSVTYEKNVTDVDFSFVNAGGDVIKITYKETLSAALDLKQKKNGRQEVYVKLKVIFTPLNNNGLNLNAQTAPVSIPLAAPLEKIKKKCPKVIVAEGTTGVDSVNRKIGNLDVKYQTSYNFSGARTFKVNEKADSQTLWFALQNDALKLAFSLGYQTGNSKRSSGIVLKAETAFSLDYIKKELIDMSHGVKFKEDKDGKIFIPCEPFII